MPIVPQKLVSMLVIWQPKVRRFLDAEYWTSAIQLAESHEELLNRMVTQFHVPAADASSTLNNFVRHISSVRLG